MAEHNMVGKRGEKVASMYLLQHGYTILETNWRWRKSELDIIARQGSWLVFAEVKTRSKGSLERPEQAITLKKQAQMIIAANAYVEISGLELECRFDVIAVNTDGIRAQVTHYPNAFYPFPKLH